MLCSFPLALILALHCQQAATLHNGRGRLSLLDKGSCAVTCGLSVFCFPPCAAFRPLYKVTRRDLDFKDCLFAGLAGLRGSICLILAQAVVTEDSSTIDTEDPSSTASVSSRCTHLCG